MSLMKSLLFPLILKDVLMRIFLPQFFSDNIEVWLSVSYEEKHYLFILNSNIVNSDYIVFMVRN
jgi:hypothetical protein